MLDERKTAILRAVVEEYIETAQPVGSGAVAPQVQASSATVRNDMALLEQEGYLDQPHTSAGRVPTEKGYRLFVDTMVEPMPLGGEQSQQVRSFFARTHGELEGLLHDTSRLLSDLTQYAAVVTAPAAESATVRSVQLVGLTPRHALVVLVLSNGSIGKHGVDFSDDVSDATLGAATAHLSRHLVGLAARAVPGDLPPTKTAAPSAGPPPVVGVRVARAAATVASVSASPLVASCAGMLPAPRPTRWRERWALAAARPASLVSWAKSMPCLPTVPLDSTTSRSACRGASPTSWTDRTVAVSRVGPVMTAAYWVRSESRRVVSWSSPSSSPWVRAKKLLTCWLCWPPRDVGSTIVSTKRR
jgi:hypothetical protein